MGLQLRHITHFVVELNVDAKLYQFRLKSELEYSLRKLTIPCNKYASKRTRFLFLLIYDVASASEVIS